MNEKLAKISTIIFWKEWRESAEDCNQFYFQLNLLQKTACRKVLDLCLGDSPSILQALDENKRMKSALEDIVNWNDELDTEWDDIGVRAKAGLGHYSN